MGRLREHFRRLCHTERMTARGRLNVRLEPELERKLAYLRQRTGLATSEW